MRTIIAILLFSLIACAAGDELRIVRRDLPKTCEDLLAQDLCTKLREIAAALKLQVSKVDDAIVDAAIKGLTTAPEIYRAVKEFLRKEVINRPCDDFLSPSVCTKLGKIAVALKIQVSKVEEFVKNAILEGVTTGTEIYAKVIEFMKKEVLSKTCVDFLAPRVCDKLKDIAAKLKVRIEKVHEMVKDAVIAGFENRQEIYENVIKFLREEVLSMTCEDVLATDICTKLKSIASKLKVQAEKVDKAVREAILKGYLTTSAVVKSVKEFFENEVLNKKCQDFLPDSTCSLLEKIAEKFKVKKEKLDKAVKEALIKGYNRIQDIIDYVKEYLKENIQCEDHLSSLSCSIIRRTAKFLGVQIQKAEAKLRELVSQGKARGTELYRQVIAFIRGQILG